MTARSGLALVTLCALAACASKRTLPGDDAPTLKSLASRQVVVEPDQGIVADETQAIAAYRKFLETAPRVEQRAQAMRRLGDLEMDLADNRSASGKTADGPDYRAAVARYEEYLKSFPNDPGNDRVLYQLSRAHEQAGQLESALATLDRLVHDFPHTAYRDEVEFRRGELLFTSRDYVHADKAYSTVLAGNSDSPYRHRALYMQGWSVFKQGRLEDALKSFFGVLDLKIAGHEGEGELDDIKDLSRADRELVEDTFRVTSLCLENLQGAQTIPAYIDSDARRSYEFRVYRQLGELYLKQERIKDAADTFGAFARLHPLHAQAPVLQARVIDIYEGNGFATLALQAKKDYVAHYGADSEFRQANPSGWQHAQPLVKTHLSELARHFHASAQKSRSAADYDEAFHWYREWLKSFPDDPEAAQQNFLLAELLFEDKRFAEAATEYEKAAYGYAPHAKSADAGYAALLAYVQQEKLASAAELPALQRSGIDSAQRFAKAFPADPRTGSVLADAADKLYALHDTQRASDVAEQVLALNPPAADAQRRVAWTVVAHTAFERGAFDRAEQGYQQVLALTPEKDARRAPLVERLAASVYKQGEHARDGGHLQDAVRHFQRVATVAPDSPVRATAQYDAAAAQIALKDWDAAARTLQDFRTRYPRHPLQADVATKLAVVYGEKGDWAQAAGEYERIATEKKDPALARAALWQAAELYDKGKAHDAAGRTYERYLKEYPQPLVAAEEARFRLARIAHEQGQAARELAWQKEIFHADQHGGSARTERTRYLGASAALAMADPVAESYRSVNLIEPLARNLKLKKARMEEALKAYGVAADYGVADVSTAATFHIASLYQDFGRSLLKSQRPRKLSKVELEQYNVMLEEQAFPFEEKATQLHEVNARRASQGIYDRWVRESFAALAQLRPLRYGKTERTEEVIDAIR